MAADGQYRRFIETGYFTDFRFHHTDHSAVPDHFLHDIGGDAELGKDFLFPGIGADVIELRCGRKRKFGRFLPRKEIIENIRDKKQILRNAELRILLAYHRI